MNEDGGRSMAAEINCVLVFDAFSGSRSVRWEWKTCQEERFRVTQREYRYNSIWICFIVSYRMIRHIWSFYASCVKLLLLDLAKHVHIPSIWWRGQGSASIWITTFLPKIAKIAQFVTSSGRFVFALLRRLKCMSNVIEVD